MHMSCPPFLGARLTLFQGWVGYTEFKGTPSISVRVAESSGRPTGKDRRAWIRILSPVTLLLSLFLHLIL